MSTGNTTRAGTPVYEYTIDLAKIVKDTFTHSDTKKDRELRNTAAN